MFKCFWIKRKLSDYLEGALSVPERDRVRTHVAKCAGCQRSLLQMETLSRLAAQKRTPEMSEEFWKKFDWDLNARLDEKLGAVFNARKASLGMPVFIFRRLRRPVFVTVSLAVIALAVGLNVLVVDRYTASVKVARGDESSLINDLELLDEVSQENGTVSSPDEDAAEIEMLYLLDPASIEQMG